MPNHQTHTYMDRLFFGKSFWKLHDYIDSAYWFNRRWHRKYYHDCPSAIIIAKNIYPNDPVAIEAAIFHITLDSWCSNNAQIKKQLKDAAKKYYQNMKRSNKKNKLNRKIKIPKNLQSLISDLKKALEAQKTYYQFYFKL